MYKSAFADARDAVSFFPLFSSYRPAMSRWSGFLHNLESTETELKSRVESAKKSVERGVRSPSFGGFPQAGGRVPLSNPRAPCTGSSSFLKRSTCRSGGRGGMRSPSFAELWPQPQRRPSPSPFSFGKGGLQLAQQRETTGRNTSAFAFPTAPPPVAPAHPDLLMGDPTGGSKPRAGGSCAPTSTPRDPGPAARSLEAKFDRVVLSGGSAGSRGRVGSADPSGTPRSRAGPEPSLAGTPRAALFRTPLSEDPLLMSMDRGTARRTSVIRDSIDERLERIQAREEGGAGTGCLRVSLATPCCPATAGGPGRAGLDRSNPPAPAGAAAGPRGMGQPLGAAGQGRGPGRILQLLPAGGLSGGGHTHSGGCWDLSTSGPAAAAHRRRQRLAPPAAQALCSGPAVCPHVQPPPAAPAPGRRLQSTGPRVCALAGLPAGGTGRVQPPRAAEGNPG